MHSPTGIARGTLPFGPLEVHSEAIFDPEKYQMTICPVCDGCGHIQSPDDV